MTRAYRGQSGATSPCIRVTGTGSHVGSSPVRFGQLTATTAATLLQPSWDCADTKSVRYVKLALGVLLVIFGAFATVGAILDGFWYLTSCLGASDPVTEYLCPSGLTETMLLGAAAVILDAGAFIALRNRTRTWTIRSS